jgi:hypothetical protein
VSFAPFCGPSLCANLRNLHSLASARDASERPRPGFTVFRLMDARCSQSPPVAKSQSRPVAGLSLGIATVSVAGLGVSLNPFTQSQSRPVPPGRAVAPRRRVPPFPHVKSSAIPSAPAGRQASPFASIGIHSRLNSFASLRGQKSSKFSTVRNEASQPSAIVSP